MKMPTNGAILFTVLIIVLLSAVAGQAENDFVVTFAAELSQQDVDQWVLDQNCRVRYRFHTSNSVWVEYPAAKQMQRATLRANKDVIHVLPGLVGIPDLVPNDPLYPDQWHLLNQSPIPGQPEAMDADIQAEQAWDIRTSAASTTIAILDDGILLSHPDLVGNLVPGWDIADNDDDPSPALGDVTFSHGTMVSGVAGAVGNNGIGVAGVCWNVQLMPIKMHPTGSPDTYSATHAAVAVDYAVAQGVDIINCSWHFEFYSDPPHYSAFSRAFQAASDSGIVVVVAAGNSWADLDGSSSHRFPAKFNFANMVTVAATNLHDGYSRNTGFGVNTVDIAAPGTRIPSTYVDLSGAPDYILASGTSFSTSMVAGAIALIKEARPDLSYPSEILQLMYDGAEVLPSLAGVVAGGRRLNLLRCLAPLDETPPGAIDFSIESTATSVTLSWVEPGDDGSVGQLDHFAMFKTGRQIPAEPLYDTYDLPATGGPGTIQTYRIDDLLPGSVLNIALAAVDDQHNRSTAMIVVPEAEVEVDQSTFTYLVGTGEQIPGSVVLRNISDREAVMAPYLFSGDDWLTFSTDEFVIAPHDSVVFTFQSSASGLCQGSYSAQIAFVHAGYTGSLDFLLLVLNNQPEIATDSPALDFGEIEPGSAQQATITISNLGCDDLDWDAAMSSQGPWSVDQTAGTLAPGSATDLVVTVAASVTGPINLVISSNDPLNSVVTIPVEWSFMQGPSGVFPSPNIVNVWECFPNPFNPQTTIAFDLPNEQPVSLRVFDMSGRLIRELIDGDIIAQGHHESIWNGRDDNGRRVASGTYFYRFEAGEYSETKRMALIK